MFEATERDQLVALLRGSLAVWGIAGGAEAAGEMAIVRTARGDAFAIARTAGPDGAPGWRVSTLSGPDAAGPDRFHPSIVGVLRDLHDALRPDRPPSRMVIAPAAPPPDD